MKKVFIPVHLGAHWCLAIINMDNRNILYYDSVGTTNRNCTKCLRKYLRDEASTKSVKLNLDEWEDKFLGAPQQTNGYDCGMFMLCYADRASLDLPVDFSQQHMAAMREQLLARILSAASQESQ